MERRGFAELIEELEFQAPGSDIETSDDDDDYEAYSYDVSGVVGLGLDPESSDGSDPDLPGPSTRPGSGRGRGRQPSSGVKRRKTSTASRSTSSSRSTSTAATDLGDDNGWVENLNDYPMNTQFTADSGLHIPDDLNIPLDFFLLVFDKDMLKLIKKETNRYAREQLDLKQPLRPKSRYHEWHAVTLRDLRKFITVLIHMAVLKKTSLLDYWSTKEIVKCDFPSTIMPRDRFLLILTFLHLNDNSFYIPRGTEGHDPLHKVRPLYDALRIKFRTLYTPKQDVAIDEAICPWKGNINYRVYMKDKPHKWGIKLYELCESESGYVFDFEIYCGDPGLSNRPVDVCLRLMEPLLDRGYNLFTDNYYTCPELSFKLADRGTNTVGTVRSNRVGLSKLIREIPLQRGESTYRRKGSLVALRWKDKKDVYVLSTIHDPTETMEVTTRVGTRTKPKAIQDYIMKMGGVDKSDQLMSYVPLRRRTSKAWKKVFFHLFALSLLQSQILYNKFRKANRQTSVKLPDFLKLVGMQMAQQCRHRDVQDHPLQQPSVGHVNRLTGNHFLFPLPATASKAKPRRDCKVCKEKSRTTRVPDMPQSRKRVETHYWCPDCQVALCLGQCFKDYHTKVDYAAVD